MQFRMGLSCKGTRKMPQQCNTCRTVPENWGKTSYAGRCDKAPTVHCLQHTFVVKRMNLWLEEGVSLNEMMPFLCRYLGHSSPDKTFYYYHQVDSAFRIIRDRDKVGIRVIPEVLPDE